MCTPCNNTAIICSCHFTQTNFFQMSHLTHFHIFKGHSSSTYGASPGGPSDRGGWVRGHQKDGGAYEEELPKFITGTHTHTHTHTHTAIDRLL